jgi:hypothetical protein
MAAGFNYGARQRGAFRCTHAPCAIEHNSMGTHFRLAAAIWLSLAACAPARDIFVNNQIGDDRRAGVLPQPAGEGGGPCRSIAKALRIAQPGDRIVIANTGVPYRESITVQGPRHSGTDSYPLVISGNGAVLDGAVSLADATWEYVGNDTFRTRPLRMSFQLLFLDNVPAVRRSVVDGRPPQLAPREWCSIDGWIHFRVDEGKLPEAYHLSCCGEQAGITLYEVHDVIIQDLAIRGFQLDGVNCHDNVKRTDLIRITSQENGRSGFSVGGASRVRIDTCTAAGNGAAQVRLEGYCTVELLDNQLDPATAPAISREGGRIVSLEGGE